MNGVFAESTYLVGCRKTTVQSAVADLMMKPSGVGSGRIVYTTETGWDVIDFLVDSRGCVLLFEVSWRDGATRLRLLSLNKTTSAKTRDLAHNIGLPKFRVCVQVTEF